VAGAPEISTSAAAERNKQPILDELRQLLLPSGKVLEIASGTGQHVIHFAAGMPGITWQPTDQTPEDLACIAARSGATGLINVAAPRQLDVLQAPWRVDADFDAILCINMIHISPWETTPALFAGAARHLRADGSGLVVLYGPYREGGRHTAPSNETFEQWLREKDPRFGVRNLEDVEAVARGAGFSRIHLARLPANNLLLAFARGAQVTA
jgi:cyclopropane fatty-acyl-phospholipid synthase-like methyltransferase